MSTPPTAKPTNFLRTIIERDVAQGAVLHTRFPPEPNGYLHIGHAKSICINFGLAKEYGGSCNLRFDDTNPEKEDKEYVDAIVDAVKWLGFEAEIEDRTFYASAYFDFMYRAAEVLIENGYAYVDEQTPEEIRANRGSFGHAGKDSPFRGRTPAENLSRFREMREGVHPDGAMVLRAKIDMSSPNLNMRDPALYRIRRATHHNTGDLWCIYPMYTFAHPIEDALEGITHSLCTLEFEDQRPFYDWLLERLIEAKLLEVPAPRQYEFSRLNLTHVLTSKRKLAQLVSEGHVSGWDDPRMPTIAGLRRRGYTPESIRLFVERIGVSKSDSWIDYSSLETALRDDLEHKAHRGMVVLDPVKLVLTNWDELRGAGHLEPCSQPALPHAAEGGPVIERSFVIGREIWIERTDFEETPPKGYRRLFPGNKVRLKGGYIIECTGCEKDEGGNVATVFATVVPDTKSGTAGAMAVKVKSTITWVSVADGVPAEVRLYGPLFREAQPEANGNFLEALSPSSVKVVRAYVEPSVAGVVAGARLQFERLGYFVADSVDHVVGRPVFNKITGLKGD